MREKPGDGQLSKGVSPRLGPWPQAVHGVERCLIELSPRRSHIRGARSGWRFLSAGVLPSQHTTGQRKEGDDAEAELARHGAQIRIRHTVYTDPIHQVPPLLEG